MIKASLKNPVAVLVASIAVFLAGGVALTRLPVDLFPELSVPVIIVGTSFPGAAPEAVEQNITIQVERAVAQAWNVDAVTSSSRQGLSIVQVWFRWGSDIDAALLDVQQQVQAIGDILPEHARPPMITKFDLSSLPVSFVTIKGGGLDERALYDIAENIIVPQLASVEGVAAATTSGGRIRQINVDLDPNKLRDTGLSLLDVEGAIRRANVVVPSGSLRSGLFDYGVFSNAQMVDLDEIGDVVIQMRGDDPSERRANQIPIRVRDVAEVIDSHREQNQIVRADGERAVYLKVYKQPGANTIQTVEALKTKLTEIHGVPEGVELEATFDQSTYINNAIESLQKEALLGTSLAMAVVLLFLATFSGTLIVGLSLPLSVLATLAVLYLTGHTLNVFTLGGLALAVGRLVDNAIIVLESIHRHQDLGKPPLQAAIDGSREVAAPVFAATLTTVIVFVPVWFLTGISKYLFTPMGLTIGVSIFASYFISLTVIPVLARRFGREEAVEQLRKTPFQLFTEKIFGRVKRFLEALDRRYSAMLERVMNAKAKLFAGVLIAFAGSLYLASQLGADFFPPIDEGELTISFRAPIGTRVEETELIGIRMEELVREVIPPEDLRSVLTSIGAPKRGLRAMLAANSGPHGGTLRVELAPTSERRTGVDEYIARLRERAESEFAGYSVMFSPRGTVREIINFGYKAPIVVEVRGYDLEEGSEYARRIERVMSEIPGLTDVKALREDDYPNVHVELDRQRAARFGITQDEVARVLLGSVFGNTSRPPFITDPQTGVNYEIIARLAEEYRADLDSVGEISLLHHGRPIMLRSIADIRRTVGPLELLHRNQERVVEVVANVAKGADVASVSRSIQEAIDQLEAPRGFSVSLKGQAEEQESSNRALVIALLVSLLIVYMVMAAQFRSLMHPLIIMATVPLGLIGVFAALYITNTSFSSTSMMGIIMMVGIVVANGILLVSYANDERERGASPEEAALNAGRVRLRPILMTSLAVIFGLIPMAIGGPGSETYAPLARAVMGGLLVSTLLTLFVVPVLYTLAERRFPTDIDARKSEDAAIDAA